MAIFSSLKHLFSHKEESENKEVESNTLKEEVEENPYEAYKENFETNKNTPYVEVEEVEPYMIEVCGVVYESGKVYYYESNGFDLKKGDAVIVNSTNGPRGAIVVLGNHFIDPDSIKGLSVVSAIVERNVYGLSEEERMMTAVKPEEVKEETQTEEENALETVQEENSEVVSVAKASEIFNEEVKPEAVEESNETHEQVDVREFEYVLKTFRSSKAKLINSTEELKKAYNDILNVAHKYKKGRVRSSFTRDMICIGRTRAAILKVSPSGKNMRLYLNLDDSYLDIKKYHLKSYANKKTYARTPLRIRVKSERSIKYAIELLDQVFINANAKLERHPKEYINYSAYLVPMSEEEMLERGLIKKKMVKQYKTFFNK